MAQIGLEYLVCAPIKETDTAVSYDKGLVMSHAIKADISVEIIEAKLYADNRIVESIKEFKSGKVKLNGDNLSYEVQALILGHKIDKTGESEKLIASSGDVGKDVGVGFFATVVRNKVKFYRAIWLAKVLFGIPNEALETKGENIAFKTPEIEGTVMTDIKSVWKEEQMFTTGEQAKAWLNTKANIEEEEDNG